MDIEQSLQNFKGLTEDLLRTPIYCALGEVEIRLNPAEWSDYSVSETFYKYIYEYFNNA